MRRLIEKGYAIIKNCFDDQENVDEIVDFAVGCIFEVSEKKIKPSFFEVKDQLKSGFETLEMCEKSKGIPTGIPTGFKQFDSLTSGFQNSDLIILAARPSMGKTAFALNIARNAAVDSNTMSSFIFYHETTLFDIILSRILADDPLTMEEIAGMGHGGLGLQCEVCHYHECSFG